MTSSTSSSSAFPLRRAVLLGAVFLVANCGLVYELLAGTISSYLVGSAVFQFSIVVGVFMAAMGLGAYLSRFIETDLFDAFVTVELVTGVVGGFSALVLYLAFLYLDHYTLALYGVCVLIGTFVGMEIPLVLRLLEDRLDLKVNVSAVLGLDYVGALTASIAFPLLFLPWFGQLATAFFFGLLNVTVALVCCWAFRHELVRPRRTATAAAVAAVLLLAGLSGSTRLVSFFETQLYRDTILLSRNSSYQRVVMTQWRDDLRLYLDGNLQFSTRDEHRYHETLVHTVMGFPGRREQVLVLGGGDGMAAREVLKYDDVERIDLVELDPMITEMFTERAPLRELNDGALTDPRVHVHNGDAMEYLESLPTDRVYDRVIIDFPDPNNPSLGKLYTAEFYRLLVRHLAGDGYVITQATAAFQTPRSFRCIQETLADTEHPRRRGETISTAPLHAFVPSLGDWGFVLASPGPIRRSQWERRVETEYLTAEQFQSHFVFPEDMRPAPVDINHLDNQVLVQYYEQDWRKTRR